MEGPTNDKGDKGRQQWLVCMTLTELMEWENNPSGYSICSHGGSAGRRVIEFKVHWHVGGGNLLLFYFLKNTAPRLLVWFTARRPPNGAWGKRHRREVFYLTQGRQRKRGH